ncbi:FAD-dependent oxidoreductase [Citromicrobium bathyomarinum]|uniref:NAD(P)/FAD-dependent oxidoreductase n=1 Tax=Citromicrobium bathyomarinum TaxID=72174 RepID=UPI00315B2780
MADYDVAIIGAGIAGASLAAEIAPHARVLLLEAEDLPGYHTTGRSAAFWEECYGGPEIVPLTRASAAHLRDGGFLAPRGALYVGRQEDAAALDAFEARFAETGAHLERLAPGQAQQQVPLLRPEWCEAIWQPQCADIDVAALHQHYLRAAKAAGVVLVTRARIETVERDGKGWLLRSADGREWRAAAIANAAGAWADTFAELAGARALGVQPLQRTMLQLKTEPALPRGGPLTLDISGKFYFKPESGGSMWFSPHDETPMPPCDAAPDELAVAEGLDRLEKVIDLKTLKVERTWAGLRSFAPDRKPVIGWDARVPGFFWFAGQGGFGIQTAPATARLGSQVFLDIPRDAMTDPLDAEGFAPARFG